jgi:hypothetical protein
MARSIVKATPSSVFADNQAGDVLRVGNKWYCLVGVDPWSAYLVRYYWFDRIMGKLHTWIKGKKERSANAD